MPKRKGGYTNKPGVKFSKRQYAQLKNAIKNYNRRLATAIKKTPEELRKALPAKAYLSQIRDAIGSNSQAKAIINRLNRFRGEGFEIIDFNGLPTTKAQLQLFTEDVQKENKRRRKIRREIEQEEASQGRFRTRSRSPLKDLDIEAEITKRLTAQIEDKVAQSSAWDEVDVFSQNVNIDNRTKDWQNRYLAQLEVIRFQGQVMGVDNIDELIDGIIQIVSNLSPLQFYYAQETIPVAHIGITSDVMLFLNGINEIYQAWSDFSARFGL